MKGVAALCFLLTLFISTLLSAQIGNIVGTITDSSGEKLSFAMVSIDSVFEDGKKYESYTNNEGKCRIDQVPVGTYNVKIVNVGYVPHMMQGIKVRDHVVTFLNVQLKSHEEEWTCKYKKGNKKCPACRKKDEVIPIVYGLPVGERDWNKYYFAGCKISYCDPKWFCKRDSIKFGRRE